MRARVKKTTGTDEAPRTMSRPRGTHLEVIVSHPGEPPSADEQVMELLQDHVPLTLLVDLVDAPASEQVLAEEGLPEQSWWEPTPPAGSTVGA